MPDAVLLFADNLVVFDHVRHKLIVLANCRLEGDLTAAYADAIARIDQIVARLRKPLVVPETPNVLSDAPWQSNFDEERFEGMVLEAK